MCKNPEIEVFDGSRVPGSAPATCVNCGQVLYLACGPDSPTPTCDRRSLGRQNARYAPKPCARCLQTFQPTGPRSLYCTRSDCAEQAAPITDPDATEDGAVSSSIPSYVPRP